MKKQHLQAFTEQQLHKYLATAKQRIKQMRELTVQLQSQNADLAKEYSYLLLRRKELQRQGKKSLLKEWYDSGKKSMHEWIDLVRGRERNEYDPQPVIQPPRPTNEIKAANVHPQVSAFDENSK